MSTFTKWIVLLSVLSTLVCGQITPAMKHSAKVTLPTAASIIQSSPVVKFRKILIKVGANGQKAVVKPATKTTNTVAKVVSTIRRSTGKVGGVVKTIVTPGVKTVPVVQRVIKGAVAVAGKRVVLARPAMAAPVQIGNPIAWKNYPVLGAGSKGGLSLSGAAMSAKYIASLFKKLEGRAHAADALYKKSRQAALAIYAKIQQQRAWVKNGINSLRKSADGNLLQSAGALQQILTQANVKPAVKKVAVKVVAKKVIPSTVRVNVRKIGRRRLLLAQAPKSKFADPIMEQNLLKQILGSDIQKPRSMQVVNNQQLIANLQASRLMANNAAKKATLALNQLKGRQDKDIATPGISNVSIPRGAQLNQASGLYNVKKANGVLGKLLQMWAIARNGMARARAIRLNIEKEIAVARTVTAAFLSKISKGMGHIPIQAVAAPRPVAKVAAKVAAKVRVIRAPARIPVRPTLAKKAVLRVAAKPKVVVKAKPLSKKEQKKAVKKAKETAKKAKKVAKKAAKKAKKVAKKAAKKAKDAKKK